MIPVVSSATELNNKIATVPLCRVREPVARPIAAQTAPAKMTAAHQRLDMSGSIFTSDCLGE